MNCIADHIIIGCLLVTVAYSSRQFQRSMEDISIRPSGHMAKISDCIFLYDSSKQQKHEY